jgi:CRP-like cAMP-binding protein
MNSVPSPHFDSNAFLSTPGPGHTIKKYGSSQVIFAQGDLAQDIFYIQAGQVKITVVSQRGKEAVIGILSADHFFGEGALNGQRIRLSSATTIEDSTIVQLSREQLVRTLEQEAKFAEFFIHHLLSRNLRIEEDLVDQLFNSSEKRLARILLLLANFGKEGKPETVIPDITQETLAEMVGTTRSRVSFFMNKFRKLGFIEYNGKLHIHSSLLNVVLHD